jgi:TRAP-type C4-dicarboxylate transport system substrate-binding protein
MFEPLLMSKSIFAQLPKAQQDLVMAVGAEMEKFALDGAKADDQAVAGIYAKAGAKVFDLDDATLRKWQTIAKGNAWKDFGERNETCGKLLAAAQKLL